MKYYDISMRIHEEMPLPQHDQNLKPLLSHQAALEAHELPRSRLEIDLRTGTHLIAPILARPDGDSVDLMSPTCVLTTCRLVDLSTAGDEIVETDLALFGIQAGEFILIKTRNSLEAGEGLEVQLTLEAARYLARIGVKGVGLDALALKKGHEREIIELLFERGCALLVGLRLKAVSYGSYRLIALPLRIEGAEASPVRALLLEGV
ncbi:cyclase family protein [Acidaminobacter sp.]|uniref:cyclase family protein n=1 Tax=Acidaminobacter sp. TaxID=1872102 RepID=UPI00137C5E61|nr:cyclase family protein [Acidaminobacter sp.]MDK9711006.1 cyclase family protein [Acidaminobacter sp.]MZQ98491.1 cyclase family protein [Acidaminobacter sp.]